jgi:hypothetical protein
MVVDNKGNVYAAGVSDRKYVIFKLDSSPRPLSPNSATT